MYDPPPGYDDLIGDSENTPVNTHFTDLDVEDVGVVRARKPMPNSIEAIAMAATPKVSDQSRCDYLVRFVQNHLEEGELDRVLYEMVTGTMPSESMEKIARAIATWGTARPTSPSSLSR